MNLMSRTIVGGASAALFGCAAWTVMSAAAAGAGEARDPGHDDSAAYARAVCAVNECPFGVVQIRYELQDGRYYQGTGVLIDGNRVVTAAHVVQGEGQTYPPPRIRVIFGGRNGKPEVEGLTGGERYSWSDTFYGAPTVLPPNGDLAVIDDVKVPDWAHPVALADTEPKEGDLLTSVGLESPDAVRVHAAPYQGRATRTIGWFNGEPVQENLPYLKLGVQAQRGDSGGPVFNREGKLVGINSAIGSYTHDHVETIAYGGWTGELHQGHQHPCTFAGDVTTLSSFLEQAKR